MLGKAYQSQEFILDKIPDMWKWWKRKQSKIQISQREMAGSETDHCSVIYCAGIISLHDNILNSIPHDHNLIRIFYNLCKFTVFFSSKSGSTCAILSLTNLQETEPKTYLQVTLLQILINTKVVY